MSSTASLASFGQNLEKPAVFLGRFARQVNSKASARASTAAAFGFTWFCPLRTLYHISVIIVAFFICKHYNIL
jgi:hypothetical protein